MKNYEALIVIPFSTDDALAKEEFLEYITLINKKISTDIDVYVKEIEEKEYTPENIKSLNENEIFVFGSNEKGYHGAGAALTALNKFGAVLEQGDGI